MRVGELPGKSGQLIQIFAAQLIIDEIGLGVIIINRFDDGDDHFTRRIWFSGGCDFLERMHELFPRFFRANGDIQLQQARSPRINFAFFVHRLFPRGPKVLRGFAADARQQSNHSLKRHFITRIGHKTNKGGNILDVSLLEEAHAAGDLIGNAAAS